MNNINLTTISSAKHLPVAVLCLLALIALWTVIRRSNNGKSKINLDDLLLGEDDKMSRAAVVLMASFAVTTWGMVYMWLNDKMTEAYFGAYGLLFVTPAVTKLIVNAGVAKAKAMAGVGSPPSPPDATHS